MLLFIYSDAGVIAAKPQVGAFINYYISNAAEFANAVSYFPVSERVNRLNAVSLLAGMGGM